MRKRAGIIKKNSFFAHKQQIPKLFEINDNYSKFLIKSLKLVKLFESKKKV
ncbi:hypothetical protein [Clostridium sp.]|jgi:hypothetical protein|uniref:hypothetical protein n=1 Tax=Clostridium sp. TaxID=1506 RepID=UPI002590F208|nr:hypothetical protein [Clostridium sp.]MDF2503073.1 hypothetical protein [Clostridium sp.]